MARRQEPLAKTEILGLAAMGLAVLVMSYA